MTSKKRLEIASSIMDGITECRVWEEIMASDMEIREAETRLDRAIEAAKPYLPDDVLAELELSAAEIGVPFAETGIAYGINVAFTLREVLEHQIELSSYRAAHREDK